MSERARANKLTAAGKSRVVDHSDEVAILRREVAEHKANSGTTARPVDRWLRIKDLQAMFDGRSRASIYRDIERGHLPPPTTVMGVIPYWNETRLREFLDRRAEELADKLPPAAE